VTCTEHRRLKNLSTIDIEGVGLGLWSLTALLLYRGGHFFWWSKPEYPEKTTDHEQATGKRVYLFCNLQSRARTYAVLVIGLYELLGNPTT
jgi:hypothetical protein